MKTFLNDLAKNGFDCVTDEYLLKRGYKKSDIQAALKSGQIAPMHSKAVLAKAKKETGEDFSGFFKII